MMISPALKYYGRGPLKIPVPRAYSRNPRKEWPVSPSLLILMVSVTTIFIVNYTLLDKKRYQFPKTTIIIPHKERVPEPTVPKSLPLIEVLKTAAKKTVEPPRVVEEKKIPESAIEKPLSEKKIEPLKPLDKQIQPRSIEKDLPISKLIPEKKIISEGVESKPIAAKEIPARNILTETRPVPHEIQKSSRVPADIKTLSPKEITRSEFIPGALPSIETKRPAVKESPVAAAPPVSSKISRSPEPALTQWESARLPQSRSSSEKKEALSIPAGAADIPSERKIVRETTAPLPKFVPSESHHGDSAEDVVIIRSRAIGSSERVRILKQDIMKKAKKLNPGSSPYKYRVGEYICTLTVEESKGSRKVIIDFNPPDAPFEVVSELERTIR